MLRDGSDKISVLKVFNKFNHTVAEFHIQGLSQPSQLERVFQKFLVSFLYFPPSFPARLTTLGDSKSCANVFQQSLKGIFGTLIRDVINSGQQLIIFCRFLEGAQKVESLDHKWTSLITQHAQIQMLLQQVDCSLHCLVVPNRCYHSFQAKQQGPSEISCSGNDCPKSDEN